jgi:hypothetical protein
MTPNVGAACGGGRENDTENEQDDTNVQRELERQGLPRAGATAATPATTEMTFTAAPLVSSRDNLTAASEPAGYL